MKQNVIKNSAKKNNNSGGFDFNLNNFSGPLDLLLEYIKKKKINIIEINLLDLINQFLYIIRELNNTLNEISCEYLLMISYLIKIKSQFFFKIKSKEEIEEFERIEKDKLIKRLIEYKKYQKISKFLHDKEIKNGKLFLKENENIDYLKLCSNINENNKNELLNYEKKNEINYDFFNTKEQKFNLNSLINAYYRIDWNKNQNNKLINFEFNIEKIKPEIEQGKIRELLINEPLKEFNLLEIFKYYSIKHFLITLMALLDMSNKKEINIWQKNNKIDIFFNARLENFKV